MGSCKKTFKVKLCSGAAVFPSPCFNVFPCLASEEFIEQKRISKLDVDSVERVLLECWREIPNGDAAKDNHIDELTFALNLYKHVLKTR